MSLFWQNVRKLLPYKELEVKDLAYRANIAYSTIINGMNKGSMPHADIALKIAKVLNVSLDLLLSDDIQNMNDTNALFSISSGELVHKELSLYRQNKAIIDALEDLPPVVQESLRDVIVKTRDAYLARQPDLYAHADDGRC